MGAPTDITNQSVEEGLIDEKATETIYSSLNIIEAAEYATSCSPTDNDTDNDEFNVRPNLAKLTNKVLPGTSQSTLPASVTMWGWSVMGR